MSSLTWLDNIPFSEPFSDVYFSKENGLEETRYVFLAGNRLAERWPHSNHFTIIETGFGTGLNFLAAAELWLQTAPANAILHYHSIERYPLPDHDITRALSSWPALAPLAQDMMKGYSPTGDQCRFTVTGRIHTTLYFAPMVDVLPTLAVTPDAWFLDGFAPAKNPDMWNDTLYTQMQRLSRSGTSFATFTAAGIVKRGLTAHGFTVTKTKGFGHKRDMLVGEKV